MYERLDHCPLCNSGHFTNKLICEDYTVSHEQFVLVTCDSCNFTFTNPRPIEENISSYYQSDEYISHQDKSNNLINIAYKQVRNITLKQKEKLLKRYQQPGKLLDIGCGTGYFLEYCQKKNWFTTGIEPNEHARQQAIDKNINTLSSLDQLDKEEKFDVITLWHVLEHVYDLNEYIKKIKSHLKSQGTLFIAVPNLESYDAQYYKQYWAAYDVPRHLYHFSKNTMKKLLGNHGLKTKEIKPMKWDAYYVSLLSEKYKNSGKINYLRALITAYKSNSYARKDTNFSSLIYIVKK